MTLEERIQQMLGAKDMQNAVLATELEKAQARIAELEKPIPMRQDEPTAEAG